jgi:hypothetical protein
LGNRKNLPQHGKPNPALSLDAKTFYRKKVAPPGAAGFDFIGVFTAAVCIITFAVIYVFVLVSPEKKLSKLGLICPNCSKPLAGGVIHGKVMTTGRCPACGKAVF